MPWCVMQGYEPSFHRKVPACSSFYSELQGICPDWSSVGLCVLNHVILVQTNPIHFDNSYSRSNSASKESDEMVMGENACNYGIYNTKEVLEEALFRDMPVIRNTSMLLFAPSYKKHS